MAEITVDVGVRLKAMQSSVADLQKVLDGLQPNSSGFKALQRIIADINRDIDRLRIQTSKPFGSQNQFNQTEKTVDKLEESLEKVKITIDRIKFSDLKLDSSQTAQLDNFKQQLKDIKQEFTNFKADLKGQFLDNDFNKAFVEGINPNLINKNFDEIVKNVNSKVDSLGSALARAKADLEEFQNASKLGEKINKIPDEGLISQAGLGENFKKFFQINSKGIFGFKTGGGLQKGEIKQQFIKYLTEEFQLTEGQIKQLQDQTTAKAIRDLLSNKDFFNTQLNAATTANKKMSGAESTFTSASKNYENAAAVVARLTPLLSALSNEETSLEDKQKLVNQAIRQFEQDCVNGAKGSKTLQDSTKGLSSGLESFKQQLGQVNAQWLNLQKQQATFNSMKTAIVNFMGFNQVLNITKRAVKEAMDHIKQLDTVMNGIAIVTDMTTADLWNQVDVYSEMAQRYGTSIQGAYEVSKIYYQAGYETNEVLTLMNETLKMSKISGLDYATTTDYMMNAVKGFKMEVADAASVVDVYSALAANTAVSQQELAEAMSKTASSMAGVGSTFEDTSAMIATMVSVTRESANNIGSAMKSIASRYGELTKDPTKLLDSEGEAMSFNKVDAALKSVGITLQTTDHQFRDFTDVIVELANKWDTLDSAQQRYIATQFAGNRQQNRFLALVSNKDLLQENMEVAAASEDTGTLQALKALDSLESKLNQVQVAYQQFYTTIGVENVWKTFLDGTENVINTLNNLPKLFGKVPLGAVAVIYDIISLIKTAALSGLSEIASIWIQKTQEMTAQVQSESGKNRDNGTAWVDNFVTGISSGIDKIRQVAKEAVDAANEEAIKDQFKPTKGIDTEQFNPFNGDEGFDLDTYASGFESFYFNLQQTTNQFTVQQINSFEQMVESIRNGSLSYQDAIQQVNKVYQENIKVANDNALANQLAGDSALSSGQKFLIGAQGIAKAALSSKKLASTTSGLAMGLNTIAMLINTTSESGKRLAGTLMTVAGGLRAVGAVLQYVGSAGQMAFPWMAVISGAIGIINGISTAVETAQEKIERLEKEAEELNNEAKQAKAEYNTLQRTADKLDELKEKRYESAEAAEEYQSAVDDLASKFPEMIAGFDEAGNIILDTTDAERILAEAREKSKQATYDAAKAEMDSAKEKLNEEKEGLTSLQLGLGENNSFNAGEKRYVNFFTDGEGNLIEDSLLGDFGNKQSHGLPNSSLEEGISFETFKNELYDLASKYSEDQASIWYFLWDYIDEEKETLTNVDTLKDVLQKKIQSNDEGAQKYQELLNLLTDNTTLETQSTEIKNLFKQIKEPDFDLVANAEQLTSLSFKIEEILKDVNLDENAKAYYENLQAQLKPIIDKVKDIFTLNEAYKGNERIVISAWQQANDNNGKAWEYLEESSGLAAIITKQIQSDIDDTDYTTAEAEQASKWKEYQAVAEQFYSGLSEADQKIFNQMIEDTANYSGTDIAKYFNIAEGTDLYNAIINYYSDGVKSIQDRLKNNLTAHHDVDFSNLKETDTDFISNYAKLISDENNEFTKNEESFLNSILSQFDSLNKQGFVKRAEVVGLAGINLFEEIQTLPEDIQKSLINSILENGLTTKEGIQKTLDSFKNDKTVTGTQVDEILTDISSQIINNVALGIQTATSDLLENWDDTSKELTKALSGGLEFKEAEALITKAKSLGVSLDLNTDFVQNGDKLILTSKKFNEYWEKLNEQSEKNANEWQADIADAEILLNKLQGSQGYYGIGENEKALIEAIAPNFDWDTYLINGRLTTKGIQALQEAIQDSSESLERYNTYAQMASEELKRTQDWIEGNYKETKELKGIDLKELASGNIELGREAFNLRAARDNINSAYNSLISDVLSKGFENINLEDYNGLVFENKAAIKEAIKAGDYEQFIKDYATWAGKSIEETNALIIQAIEKDTQTTTGAAAEAVGKIQWLSDKKGFASLGDIQSLANALGISVDTILGEYNKQLDAYEVDVSQIDLSKIDNFTESVYDSINEFLKKVTDSISKGISGKLSSADVTTLNGQLKQLGLERLKKTDFAETAEGLKISQRAAIDLYIELKKIGALQDQLLFEDLAKSLEASDTNYTNISTTLARIAELEKAIKEMKPDDARLQMYKNELAVAREIARTRSSTDNKDFNFMDRALPTGMQNPIDYWNATGEAYKAMNVSAKSGYMEIQDFYNIVQEMSNMAQISGQTLHFMGQEIDGSAETAAALIQRGFSALTNVKGDGVKIALDNIGADFKTGAADMKGDFDSGIQEMAKAQIQMLDAAINMLEAIVAMENIDTSGDGILDLDELFIGGDATNGWTAQTKTWFNRFEALSGGIEVGGVDLKTALLNMAQSGEDGAERVKQFMNDLKNIDWTLGDVNVAEKVHQLVQGLFVGQEITQGTSVFEVLKVPKNAEKTTDEFKNWVKETGLAAEEADTLIRILQNGYNISETGSDGKRNKYAEAVEKLLGLEKENQKESFEKFTKGNKITQEEITLFSELDIDWDTNGKITNAIYTASDGSKLPLSKDESSWQDEIVNYEKKVSIAKNLGGSANDVDLTKTSPMKVKLTNGAEVEGAVTAIAGGVTASYRGQSQNFYGDDAYQQASNWIKEQAELEMYHVGETGGAVTKRNKITGELEVVPAFTITGTPTDPAETEKEVQNIVNLKGKELTDYIERNTNKETGKITLPNIPIEFEEGTDASYIQEIVDKYFGDGTFDTLPGKIAEGITAAFTQDTSIGEAIGQGIRTALTTGTGENGQPQDILLPTLTLKPESITIQADEITPTITGVNENNNLPIPSITIEAQKVLLTSTIEPNSDGLNIPTSIPQEDLSIIYSALNLIGYKEDVNESGVYLPAILEKQPVVAAYLAMLLLMSNSDTDYNETFVNNPSENLKKKFEAAAILAKLALSSDENTDFIEGSISVGEGKQLKIKQVLEAIATGNIKINSPSDGSSIEEGNIDVKKGENQLTLSETEWITVIDAIKAELESNYQVIKTGVTLTENDLTLDPKELIQPISGIRYIKDKDLEEITKDIEKTKIKMPDPGSQLFVNDRNAAAKAMGGREAVQKYVDSLQDIVNKGFSLTDNQKENIEYIKEVFSGGINQPQPIEGLDDLIALSNTNSDNFNAVNSLIQSLSTTNIGDLPEIATALQDIATQAQLLEAINWQTIIDGINGVTKANLVTKPNSNSPEENGGTSSNSTQTVVVEVDANTEKADEKVTSLNSSIEDEVKKKPVDIDDSAAKTTLSNLESAIQATVNKYADIYINYTQQYKDALADITKDVDKTVNIKTKGTANTGLGPKAGNVALATGTGNAYSTGNTLMGELGPELVVSHGRYFVVGQNGPEMVNLAEDAIVFNHLQTEQLLRHGKASGHAKPVTNERKATSLAIGNVGPAMASPSAALDTLKQLRAMWQSLLDASLRDLGAMGGSGGGGGGGGGGNNDTTGVVKDVERWYNWLKKIEETQNKINILTKKYTLLEKQNATETQKLANLTKQYENLADNKSTKEQLAAEQTKYRKNLLKQVNGTEKGSYNLLSAFYSANEKTGKLTLKDDKAFEKYIGKKKAKKLKNEGIKLARREYYTEEEAEEYNKNNQVKVKAGDYKGKAKNKDTIKAKNGLELIDQLQKKDNYGNLIYSAEDQYNILANLLGKKKFEKYVAKDTSGKELESWEEKVEYFFTQIESGKGEIEDLNQSIQEQTESALDDAIAMQEINEQIRELYTPTAGITEGFEEWYNELKKIESITNNLTKLSKQLDILENDRIANGKEIYKNLVEQTKQNNERIKQEEDLIEKRKAERNNLLEGELNFLKPFVDLNTEKGIATFKEQSLEEILGKDFNSEITYKKSGVAKTNKQGYFVDTKGRYYDDKGILRNKNGEKAKKGVEFGEQATTKEKNATFNFSDYKDLNALIKELKSKNENGSFKYDSSETFQILSQVPEFAEMMKYDEQGNKVYQDLASMSKEEKQEAARLVVSKLQKGIDSLNDNEKAIFDGEMNIYDAQAANLDLQRKLTETRRSLEDKVMDAIIDLRQAIIDEAQKERDAYSKAANKMVDGLNNQLKKEQEMYDKNKDDKEIETLQRQIGILQRSGGSASEIQKLQNDLADKQKDAYFKERQSEIDVIKEASDKQLEKMDQQIELMNASLEIERQNGLLWPQVIQAITNGTAVDLIGKNRKLNSESAERRDEEITGAQEEAETVEAQQKDQKQAQKVNEAIQTLPESISVNDKQTVADIRKDYDDIQDKTLISDENTQKLINAEKQIQNQEIVDDLTQKINALPETITLSNKEAVDTAQNIYNKMTDEQKALIQVDVASKLEKATTAIKNASANQAAADGVTNELNKLYPKYGFDKPAVVDAALAAWNALTKEQQALVGKEPKEKLDTAVKVKELTEKYKKNVKKEQENAIKNKESETLKLNNDLKNAKTAKEKENIQNQLSKLDGNLLSKLQAELDKKYNSFKKNLEKLGVLKKNLPKQLILNSFPKTPVIPQFAQGGTIDFTGLAMVHGSKTKPETIFNDEQTKMLKEILFKNNSLISNLQAAVFNPNSEAMNSYNNSYNENDSSIQINEVNMSVNVPSISNDYDARRAGQMALDEMVRVARKSGNRAVSRR